MGNKMMRWALVAMAAWAYGQEKKSSPDAAELKQIEATVRDYVEGYFESDADRVAKAVHPEFVKRSIRPQLVTGRDFLSEFQGSHFIEHVRGKPKRKQDMGKVEIQTLDTADDMATVKLLTARWLEYLHLAKFNGEWRIINTLWRERSLGPQDPFRNLKRPEQ